MSPRLHPALPARLIHFTQDDSANSIIEIAISYMLIFTCMLGVIQLCLMIYAYGVYAEAARVGVRYAVQHGIDSPSCSGPSTGCGDSTAANVKAAVTSYAASYVASISGAAVAVSYPDTTGCSPPSRVIVTVTYNYAPIFNLQGFNQAFHITSQGRIVY